MAPKKQKNKVAKGLQPKISSADQNRIIGYNKNHTDPNNKHTTRFTKILGRYWSDSELVIFHINTDNYKSTTLENKRRLEFLRYFLLYRDSDHIILMKQPTLHNTISIRKIKAFFDISQFYNFNLSEYTQNPYLEQQGFLLKCFQEFYQKKDMALRNTLDSMHIETNNPMNRELTRKFNRELPVIRQNYFEIDSDMEAYYDLPDFNQVDFCFHLLGNYFPNITGIWADHFHITHIVVQELIRNVFEWGFFTGEDAKKIIPKLSKAIDSLKKLEEAWKEKQLELGEKELNTQSGSYDVIKDNLRDGFSEIREHISAIMIQIITIIYDEAFVNCEPEKHFQKYMGIAVEQNPLTDLLPWFDSKINEDILQICMNYLIIPVSLDGGSDPEDTSNIQISQKIIEKLFLYISSSDLDLFYISVKGISNVETFFDKNMNFSSEEMQCSKFFYALQKLLDEIGNGSFDNRGFADSKTQSTDIMEFLILDIDEHPQIHIKRLFEEGLELQPISQNECADDELNKKEYFKRNLKICLTREGVINQLIALVRYISEKFSHPRVSALEDRIYYIIFLASENCNVAKSQIFRGLGLSDMLKMLKRNNQKAQLQLNQLATERNLTKFFSEEFLDNIFSYFNELTSFLKDLFKDFNVKRNFDKQKVLSLFLQGHFINKCTKMKFNQPREKVSFRQRVQNSMFEAMVTAVLPYYITLQLNEDINCSDIDQMIARRQFEPGREESLIKLINERDITNKIDILTISQHVCHLLIKIFNNVTPSVYSFNIYQLIRKNLLDIKGYFFSRMSLNTEVIPLTKDSEIMKLFLNFVIFPECSTLLEFPKEPTLFDTDEPVEQIEKLFKKIPKYLQEDSTEEGKKFLYDGLLLMVYKYTICSQNLVKHNAYDQLKSENSKINRLGVLQVTYKKELIELLDHINEDLFNEISEDQTAFYNAINNNDQAKNKKEEIAEEEDFEAFDESEQKEKIIQERESQMRSCFCIQTLLDQIYMISKRKHKLKKYLPKTNSQYSSHLLKSAFNEKYELLAMDEIEQKGITEKEQDERNTVLEEIVRFYKKIKLHWIKRPSDPNLMNFFQRNTENMRGIFHTGMLRILRNDKSIGYKSNSKSNIGSKGDKGSHKGGRDQTSAHGKSKKSDNKSEAGSEIDPNEKKWDNVDDGDFNIDYTDDVTISQFWSDPLCQMYIKVIERLLSQSSYGREELYKYLLQRDKEKNTNTNEVRKVLRVMLRIHYDCLKFLAWGPVQNYTWWEIQRSVYKRISDFFKNLCENNFIQFKEIMGSTSKMVEVNDADWECNSKTFNTVFIMNIMFVLNLSSLNSNEEPKQVESDKARKVLPLQMPILLVLNEFITGPCYENQREVIRSGQGLQQHGLVGRSIDDLENPIYKVKNVIVKILVSLTEGNNPGIMKKQCGRYPPSFFVDTIIKLVKKAYVREINRAHYGDYLKNKKKEYNAIYKSQKSSFGMDSGDLGSKSLENLNSNTKKSNDRRLGVDTSDKFGGINQTGKSTQKNKDSLKPFMIKVSKLSKLSQDDGVMKEDTKRYSVSKHDYNNDVRPLFSSNFNPEDQNTNNRSSMFKLIEKQINSITDEETDKFQIESDTELLNFYKSIKAFSDGIILEIAFNLYTLWLSLAEFNIHHKNRQREIRTIAKKTTKDTSTDNNQNKLNIKKKVQGMDTLKSSQSTVSPAEGGVMRKAGQKKIQEEKTSDGIWSDTVMIFDFLMSITCSVEVKDGDKFLIVNFPKSPTSWFLTTETMTQYQNSCDISDSSKKMGELFDKYTIFKTEMIYMLRLYRRSNLLFIFSSNDMFQIYKIILFILALLQNIQNLIGQRLNYDTSTTPTTNSYVMNAGHTVILSDWTQLVGKILQYIIIGLSFLFIIIYLSTQSFNQYRLIVKKYNIDHRNDSRISFFRTMYMIIVQTVFFNPSVINFYVHLIIGFIGIFWTPTFDPAHLFIITTIDNRTKFVIDAVIQHIQELMMTILFTLFIQLQISTVTQEFYYDRWDGGILGENTVPCKDLFNCWIYTINMGLRLGGGIGDAMLIYNYDDGNMVPHTIIVIIAFQLVQVVAMNIIFGIIIDSFSELRDNDRRLNEDRENVCFVCGNNRTSFSREAKSFSVHTVREHYPWNYIYYIFYQEQKGIYEMDGTENKVWSFFKNRKTGWIPIGDTKYLSKFLGFKKKQVVRRLRIILIRLVRGSIRSKGLCIRSKDQIFFPLTYDLSNFFLSYFHWQICHFFSEIFIRFYHNSLKIILGFTICMEI